MQTSAEIKFTKVQETLNQQIIEDAWTHQLINTDSNTFNFATLERLTLQIPEPHTAVASILPISRAIP
jgi:hypothetical protein